MGRSAAVLLVNLSATWFLAGLTWIVQLIHYPGFALVAESNWNGYHLKHMTATTMLIGPMMFVEALSAAALIFVAKTYPLRARWCVWIAAVLVLVNWITTAAVAVPLHNKLGEAFDLEVIQQLVTINWIRTISWSIRGLLLGYVALIVVSKPGLQSPSNNS
jgi:hypothetical protein